MTDQQLALRAISEAQLILEERPALIVAVGRLQQHGS
jgi:hypothetical protein